MEVTLHDIASELNVSAMTVSLALRHDRKINPETRARVNEVAQRMGYKARVRRPRRTVENSITTRTLGLLVRHPNMNRVQHDGNLMKMMTGIMTVADEHSLHFKLHIPDAQPAQPTVKESLHIPPEIRDGQFQALIAHGDHDHRDLAFLAHRLPVVTMGRIHRDLPIDAVVYDNTGGVLDVVTYLVGLGHQRLAWVGTQYTTDLMEEREAGFVKGCRKHGVQLHEHSFLTPEIGAEHRMKDDYALLAAVKAGVTALVCGNDAISLAVLRVLEAAGLRVPEDVSVTGFDAWLSQSERLTSYDPNFFQIGKAAARLALQRMSHLQDDPYIVSVRGHIVTGETAASPQVHQSLN